MLLIGLTGGIGSGKSTVAHYFSELGITIIDADLIAREAVTSNTKTFDQIVAHFGPEILDKEQQLNRDKLRHLIFKNHLERQWLENLLHPLILKKMCELSKNVTSPYCILEIPLLLEKNVQVDQILVVDTSRELQIQRLKQRTNMSLEEINAILNAQISREKRLAKADYIIYNNGSMTELQQQVQNLHHEFLKLTQEGKK